jgi:hypothetical protein
MFEKFLERFIEGLSEDGKEDLIKELNDNLKIDPISFSNELSKIIKEKFLH